MVLKNANVCGGILLIVWGSFIGACQEDTGPLEEVSGRLEHSPSQLLFPDTAVGTTQSLRVVLLNSGSETLDIDSMAIGGTDLQAFSIILSSVSIPSDETRAIDVFFQPQDARFHAASLVLTYHAGGLQTTSISLNGNGVACVDDDGDGYGSGCALGTDCDDGNDARYEGATEQCDGIDNDCDDAVDEDLPVATYFPDLDGDTYGDADSQPVESCAQPPMTSTNATDCNDSDASIHPMAAESCDGIDNNCNSLFDEGFPTTSYYPDQDDDGFGDENAEAVVSCLAPAGHVDVNTDCADDDTTINPAADEICDNGEDEDCDGLVDDQDPDCQPISCQSQDDCGLNSEGLACPLLGGADQLCAPLCRAQEDCGDDACRPLPGTASLGFCAVAGMTTTGSQCANSAQCETGICAGGICRELCQSQSDCPAPLICGMETYNTSDFGGANQNRFTTVCKDQSADLANGSSALIDGYPTCSFDSGQCASGHANALPCMLGGSAPCAPICASSSECGSNEICGVVYHGFHNFDPTQPAIPGTNESAGRYFETALGCYESISGTFAPDLGLLPTAQPPGGGFMGSACDSSNPEGRLACRSHLCAAFAPIVNQCTDFCDEDADCDTPQTPGWSCRVGELNLASVFLQMVQIADVSKFTLIGVCSP